MLHLTGIQARRTLYVGIASACVSCRVLVHVVMSEWVVRSCVSAGQHCSEHYHCTVVVSLLLLLLLPPLLYAVC
jgi:hypothetical protein